MFPNSDAVRQRAFAKAIPAPLKGWDALTAFGKTSQNNVIGVNNWHDRDGKWRLRRGYEEWASGLTGNVDTLMPYVPTSGTKKLFAADDDNVYAVDAGGAVGAAVLSGKSNGQWRFVNMGTSGGQFLFCCNGADTPQVYNGTAWANTTITGPTVANLTWCNLHQSRLWVGEKDSLKAWYGGVNSIGGAFTAFPLAGIASKGGYLMGMVTWTKDSGFGHDDVAVFVTSEGQALVYSGTDPASVNDWTLDGVYEVGAPIGRNFFCKAGGDAFLITKLGLVSLQTILPRDVAQSSSYALSKEINPVVRDAIAKGGTLYGWQPLIYAEGEMIILNAPQSVTKSVQYIVNPNTRSAAMFTGWDAQCFAVMNGVLYFGGKDGKVYKADYGDHDNGNNIINSFTLPFNYCGNEAINKAFRMMVLNFDADAVLKVAVRQYFDFNLFEGQTSEYENSRSSDLGVWDDSNWNEAKWSGTVSSSYQIALGGVGKCVAAKISVTGRFEELSFSGGSIIYEPIRGGVL